MCWKKCGEKKQGDHLRVVETVWGQSTNRAISYWHHTQRAAEQQHLKVHEKLRACVHRFQVSRIVVDETNANGCPHLAREHRLERYKSSAGCLFYCVFGCVCVRFTNGLNSGWFILLKVCICSWLCCVSKALFAVQGSSVIKREGHKSVKLWF